MKKKLLTGSLTILITAALAIGLGIITSYLLFEKMIDVSEFTVDEVVINEGGGHLEKQTTITFIIWFFSMISLPVFISDLLKIFKVKNFNLGKTIFAFEILAIVISYFATPPDLVSTFFMFVFCQPPILVNILSLRKKLKNRVPAN